MLETVPLLVIFVVLMSFSLGFFGIIHTATLHSIAARTYAFETFRQRTNLNYFRENGSGVGRPLTYQLKGWRLHAVHSEQDSGADFEASLRSLTIGTTSEPQEATNQEVHNQQIYGILPRNERISVNPAWIMVGYGICMTAQCGN